MPANIIETDDSVIVTPSATPSASVIWLHGLGADGYDFVPLVPELHLPAELAVRFVFPHAPVRPVTINAGYEMRAWYDIASLTADGRTDAAGLEASVAAVGELLAAERAQGVPAARIVVAGFSQGGAVALHAGLTAPERLAGVIALSSYLPCARELAARRSPANRALRVLMCHGTRDPVVAPEMGAAARDALIAAGDAVEWHAYPIAHEVSAAEVVDVARWLTARLA